ncbi:MAG: tetratricopeptide repeat protein [Bacteroidetes bacterium]|nr:tetratricopeptide repeat protein [Bacteroidota bacterium]
MKSIQPILILLMVVSIAIASGGCATNPNIAGARLDLRNKDYSRALTNINQALVGEPDNSEALLLKGDILSEMLSDVTDESDRTGFVGELTGAYALAVALDSENMTHVNAQLSRLYNAEFVRGMETFRDAGLLAGKERALRFTSAARHFRNASMMIPDSVNALINEAHAYYNGGKAQDAVDAYESVIALGHTDRELFVYLARTYELMAVELADPETQPDYYNQMIRVLETARKLYSQDEEVRILLLNAYAMSEMTSDALPFFEEIYPLEQDNQVYLYNYGTLLLRQQDYEGAITKLSQAVSLDSSYVNALFNLGAAYVNHGVSVDKKLQQVTDSLQYRLTPQVTSRLQDQQASIEKSKAELFGHAITNLESAKSLLENDLGDTRGVCHALYIAYAQTNQRSRAEEARICAN